jgi:hypothetical protein
MHCIQKLALKYRYTKELREPRTGLLPLSASNAQKQNMNFTKIRSERGTYKGTSQLVQHPMPGRIEPLQMLLQTTSLQEKAKTQL